MMKRQIRIPLMIIALVVLIGSILLYNYFSNKSELPVENGMEAGKGAQAGKQKSRGPIPVTVYVADYITIDEGIRSMGTLMANEEVEIASEISGKIDKITFNEGSKVTKGSLMVKVNDDDLQAQLKRAKFQRDMLKDKLERNRILLSKDAISREAFDQIETDYNMVEADVQLLNVKIDKTEIRAPFDGVVGFRYVSLGSYLQPNALIAKLVDYSKLKLEFSIPEKYVSKSLMGEEVQFTTEGSQRVNRARIYAVDPTVDVKTRTITIRALYDNASLSLFPGMFAKVTLGKRSGRTIVIPTESVTPEIDGTSVWLVKNDKAVKTSVKTATRTETMIEIVSGINRGDSVITTGLMQVKEGARVQVTN